MTHSLTIRGQVPSKKNNKRIVYNRKTNTPFIISSDRALDWKEDARLQLLEQHAPHLSGDTYIKMSFTNKDRRRHDLDNMCATVLDTLVECKVIEDDDCLHLANLLCQFNGVDKENPRVDIEITEVEDK